MMSSATRPRPVVLCVLDGWGFRDDAADNAVTRANAPNFRNAWQDYPHALLDASEEHVGLPKGQIGNSEVGHMNLGAGRVIFQDLPMIDRAIANDEVKDNQALRTVLEKLKATGGTLHLLGLASPGGVHAHQDHMVALAKIISDAGVTVAIHAFLDGRDVPPMSASGQIEKFQKNLAHIKKAKLVTIVGRYYAMDRDKRWERVEKAYDLLTEGVGVPSDNFVEAIQASYRAGVTDEFVLPVVAKGFRGIQDGDGILFANFRADRAREILTALLDPNFTGFKRKVVRQLTTALGMVEYSEQLNRLMTSMFPPKIINGGLGEIMAMAGLKQLRIAETEKYPHVTFFFNGGREEPYEGEERIMIPSPKVATYDLQPEMSAATVTEKVVAAIEGDTFDFIVLNYANPDMVGHTGSFDAAKKAVETIDVCLGQLFAAVKKKGGLILLTADHGNCETMTDTTTGGPHTAHTLERVPLILFNAPKNIKSLHDGKLADVAPTMLALMGLPVTKEMDGQNLIVG